MPWHEEWRKGKQFNTKDININPTWGSQEPAFLTWFNAHLS